ncbi:Imm41 family immunity protein [Shewanella sedimentimangrovi]|uniref:Uncharacterized protein n=1 Tax=Shewanella sedimentimangrovi TaxID=2814293 RepID=A0ABX7QZA8_9GAMM|nr:Imm41 family immunity protein [Shewanella sedimentimangrovi]QSX36873.1 hypothetical protein JYB85_16640 [Shewanella sedimentimangrovi]
MNLYEIERYSASHPDWEGSFSERLYEYCEWNVSEFWKLHKALVELAIALRDKNQIDKQLFGRILGIQKSVWSIVAAHFNELDAVKLAGVTDEQLHEFIERFDLAIVGLSTGEVLPESSFDLVNPLLVSN